MTVVRRLLTVGRSYVVGQNRRLAHELAKAGRWEVTAVAPRFVRGDLRPIRLEPIPGEACRLEPVDAFLTGRPHVAVYGPRLRSILRAEWDVVHVWEEPFVLAGGQVAWWTPPASRLVFATFQNIPKRYPPPFGWVERMAMWRAAGWVAFGHAAHAALADCPGYAERPSRVIPVGVDPDVYRPDPAARAVTRRELGWDDGPPVVGYLGRFIPEKGLRVLTAALAGMRTEWRALFVGGGPLEGELWAWGERFPDRVRVVTGVPHDRVPAMLNAMDVLVAPSLTTTRWKEQLGRMLIEAMACGVPVIGSDSGEIPHAIGDAGVVVPEGNAAVWSAAIGVLLENTNRRAELSARGHAAVRDRFAWGIVARAHLEFFDALTDSPHAE